MLSCVRLPPPSRAVPYRRNLREKSSRCVQPKSPTAQPPSAPYSRPPELFCPPSRPLRLRNTCYHYRHSCKFWTRKTLRNICNKPLLPILLPLLLLLLLLLLLRNRKNRLFHRCRPRLPPSTIKNQKSKLGIAWR